MNKKLKNIEFTKSTTKKLDGNEIKIETNYFITQSFGFTCSSIILEEQELDLFKEELDKIR